MRIATFFSLKRQVKKRFFVKRAMYLEMLHLRNNC